MALSVTQRTREVGIRMALGAARSDVFRLILGQGIILVSLGIGLGLIGAVAVSRALSSLLYGVGALDTPALAIAIAALAFVALLACWLPARRAMMRGTATMLPFIHDGRTRLPPSSGNGTGSPALCKLSRESNTSTAKYRLASSAGTIPSCGLGRKVPREHMSKGTRLLERVERLLGPADQLDYVIRRTVIPSAREPLRGVSRSTPRGKASLWNSERLREVQEAIGRCLRAQYDLAQPIPARLVELSDNLTTKRQVPKGRPETATPAGLDNLQTRAIRITAHC
jgi:hypothetical protein